MYITIMLAEAEHLTYSNNSTILVMSKVQQMCPTVQKQSLSPRGRCNICANYKNGCNI